MTRLTYRSLAWAKLLDVIHESMGGAPKSDTFSATLREFRTKFNGAIDAVPAIAEIFDRPESSEPSTDEIVDPINRADDVVAHIANKLQTK